MHDISNDLTAEAIDRRLWLELSPEQYGLVRELIRIETDVPIVGILDETERVIAGVAAHFPGLAPAIKAVAEHVIEYGAIYEDGDVSGACCQARRPAGDTPASG